MMRKQSLKDDLIHNQPRSVNRNANAPGIGFCDFLSHFLEYEWRWVWSLLHEIFCSVYLVYLVSLTRYPINFHLFFQLKNIQPDA